MLNPSFEALRCARCGRMARDAHACLPSEAALFLGKVSMEPTSGCWLWTAALNRDGYGKVQFRGRTTTAHRAAWALFVGAGAGPLDHKCRVRSCVNPAHLEIVTVRENTLRGEGPAALNSRKTHCGRGHPLSGPTAYTSKGKRYCKICIAAHHAREAA